MLQPETRENNTRREVSKRTIIRMGVVVSLMMVIFIGVSQRSHLFEKGKGKNLLLERQRPNKTVVKNDWVAIALSSIVATCNVINTVTQLTKHTGGFQYAFSYSIENWFTEAYLVYVDAKLGQGSHPTQAIVAPKYKIKEGYGDGASFGSKKYTSDGYVVYQLRQSGTNAFLLHLLIWWKVADSTPGTTYWYGSESQARALEWPNYAVCISTDETSKFEWNVMRAYFKKHALQRTWTNPPGYAYPNSINHRCVRIKVQSGVASQRFYSVWSGLYTKWKSYAKGPLPTKPEITGYTNMNFKAHVTYSWGRHGTMTIQLEK